MTPSVPLSPAPTTGSRHPLRLAVAVALALAATGATAVQALGAAGDASGRACAGTGTTTTYLPAPVRLVDSRTGAGVATALLPGVPVTVAAGALGADAVALLANVTVTSPQDRGHLTAWPSGTRPPTSTLNFVRGQEVANGVQLVLSAGTFRLSSTTAGHVVVDVLGTVHSDRGALRLLDDGEGCRTGEREVLVGGAGAVGPAGATGPAGPAGPPGPAGAAGSDGGVLPDQFCPNDGTVVVGFRAGAVVCALPTSARYALRETEPNDADPDVASPEAGMSGSLSATDVDVFSVVVPADYIGVEHGLTNCLTDGRVPVTEVTVTVRDQSGTLQGTPSVGCGAYYPENEVPVPPGTYTVTVSSTSTQPFQYDLRAFGDDGI